MESTKYIVCITLFSVIVLFYFLFVDFEKIKWYILNIDFI